MKSKSVFFVVFSGICVLFLQAPALHNSALAASSKPTVTAAETATDKQDADKSKSATSVKGAKKGPVITFESLVHDFGKISPGSRNKCTFKFTNTGDEVLKVDKTIKSTCGCTVPKLSKEEYAPGESGVIKVTYTAGGHPGPATRRLTVKSNDKQKPQVGLTIKATIVKKVDHEPKRLNLLLKRENAGCPDIKLTSLDGKSFSIKSVTSPGDCITIDFDPSEKATEYVLKPKVDLAKLAKNKRGRLVLRLTHPACNNITIPFTVLPEFSAEPAMINIYRAEPGKPVNREIWVLNNYSQDFEIESVSSDKGYVKVLSQEKVGKRYKIELQITPPPVSSKRLSIFRDTVTVKIKSGKTVSVNCLGFTAPPVKFDKTKSTAPKKK